MRALSISTSTHGRVLVEDSSESTPARVLVGCHGYGQSAQPMLDEMRRIPGADAWRRVSVQALHRFYTRNDQAVVASWMTREDRDEAIADNIEYLNRVLAETAADATTTVFLGFSQGASMAVRAAARGSTRASGLIVLAGDIPPDVKDDPAVTLPPTLVGCGTRDTWYAGRVEADVAWLQSRGIEHALVRFDGGHEFTDEFRTAAGAWLQALTNPSR
jgi:predicted esterase